MYYCPKCKKKFRQYQRRCPVCGGACRRGRDVRFITLVTLICVLSVLLLTLLMLLPKLTQLGQDTQPTGSTPASSDQTTLPSTEPSTDATSEPTSEPTTEPTSEPTTEPTSEPTSEPTTEPTVEPTTEPTSGGDYIGTDYTREELEALDNTSYGYGPGPNLPSQNNRPEYAIGEQNRYGKYGANFIAPDNNNVYLTFDCGYEYRITDENGNKVPITSLILDTLKEKNAKGVFFVTMHFAQTEPELIQRMINEGHAIGNHTNTHPAMPTLTIDQMVEEVMSLHDYVKEHYGYTMTLFRPPTGAFSIRSLAVVQSLGYKTVHWSFAHADWDPENQPDVAKSLQSVLDKSHSGAIYLLHAMSLTNATLLGDAIDGFREKGFSVELFQ